MPLYSQSIVHEFMIGTPSDETIGIGQTDQFQLVDRGNLLYLGKAPIREPAAFHFMEIPSGKRFTLPVPFLEYFQKNKGKLAAGSETHGGSTLALSISEFLFFDRSTDLAAFLVENRHYKISEKKFFIVTWNIRNNQILSATEIKSIRSKENRFYKVEPIGFLDEKSTGYFATYNADFKSKNSINEIWAVNSTGVQKIKEYTSTFPPSRNNAFSGTGKLVLLGYDEELADGAIFDVHSGALVSLSIPPATYGFDISADASRLILVSAKTGELQILSTDDGKKLKSVKAGTYGHTGGFWSPDEFIWVRNSGIHIYTADTFKLKKVIPIRTYFKTGNTRVQGSLIIPRRGLVLRNAMGDNGDPVKVIMR